MFWKKQEIKDLTIAKVGVTEFKFYYKNDKEYFEVDVNQRSGYKFIIKLEDYCVSKTDYGYLIKKGFRSYKVTHSIRASDDYIEVIYFFWGWLPFTRSGGTVSKPILELIFNRLNQHI